MTDQTGPPFVSPSLVPDPAVALPALDARLAELRAQRDASPLGRARASATATTGDVADAIVLTRVLRAAIDGQDGILAGLVEDLPVELATALGQASRRVVDAVESTTRGARS